MTAAAPSPLPATLSPRSREVYEREITLYERWCAQRGARPGTTAAVEAYARWQATEWRDPLEAALRRPTKPPGKSAASVTRSVRVIAAVYGLPAGGALEAAALGRAPGKRGMTDGPPPTVLASAGARSGLATLRDAALIYLDAALEARPHVLVALDIGDIRETKTGQLRVRTIEGEDVVTYGPAIDAVLAWLRALADLGVTAGPLFTRIDRTGRPGWHARASSASSRSVDQRLHPHRVLDILRRHAGQCGQ